MSRGLKYFIVFLILGLALFLRLWRIESIPASLYWDEASIGYEAFCTATTGKDSHGHGWLQAYYPAYGDYKAPIYIWLSSLAVKVFGAGEMAVRLPSILAGTLLVLVVYWLAQELRLVRQDSKRQLIAIWASLLTAVSPWAIQFSRAGFEANLAVLFCFLAIACWLAAAGGNTIRGARDRELRRGWLAVVGFLFAGAAVYTYFSARIFLLGVLLVFVFLFRAIIWRKRFWFIGGALIMIALVWPLFSSPYYQKSQRFRWSTEDIFDQKDWVNYSSRLVEDDGLGLAARIVHHRYWYLAKEYFANYFTHFSPNFLFVTGDSNLRHGTGHVGQSYLVLLPFFFLGLLHIAERLLHGGDGESVLNAGSALLLGLLILGPAAASVPMEVPHALRSLNMVVPLNIFIAFGLVLFFDGQQKRGARMQNLNRFDLRVWSKFLFIGLIFLLNSGYYFHYYFVNYARESASDWQYGYKQVALMAKKYFESGDYDRVIAVNPDERIMYYYLYYWQFPCQKVQAVNMARPEDVYYEQWFRGFDSVDFRKIDWSRDQFLHKVLLVGQPGDFGKNARIIDRVYGLNGNILFELVGV